MKNVIQSRLFPVAGFTLIALFGLATAAVYANSVANTPDSHFTVDSTHPTTHPSV
jgi:hypothetical protein